MATLKRKIAAEVKVREMLELQGVPLPDVIEYGYTCIRCIWMEPKVALVVDLDEFLDDDGAGFDVDVFPPKGGGA